MSIVVAILAKDKAHCLPLYLDCIYNQTFPKDQIHLYVRTNDNTDDTATILKQFLENHGKEYKSVLYNEESISPNLKNWKQHEWNRERFQILGKIRQESIEYAKQKQTHYFVADCDNFIINTTIEDMFNSNKQVVAPMLKSTTLYSNFHYEVEPNGYIKLGHPTYFKLLNKQECGLTIVKVVHCTYFIHNSVLIHCLYDDGSKRHEYVIFSENLRKNNITQYLDNRKEYGFLTFAENSTTLKKEIQDRWLESEKSINLNIVFCC